MASICQSISFLCNHKMCQCIYLHEPLKFYKYRKKTKNVKFQILVISQMALEIFWLSVSGTLKDSLVSLVFPSRKITTIAAAIMPMPETAFYLSFTFFVPGRHQALYRYQCSLWENCTIVWVCTGYLGSAVSGTLVLILGRSGEQSAFVSTDHTKIWILRLFELYCVRWIL